MTDKVLYSYYCPIKCVKVYVHAAPSITLGGVAKLISTKMRKKYKEQCWVNKNKITREK